MLEKSECDGCKGNGIDCADGCIKPAPAEQGDGLKPLQDCIDELSRMIDRYNTQSLEDGSWRYDCQTVADAQEALDKLASRPRPEPANGWNAKSLLEWRERAEKAEAELSRIGEPAKDVRELVENAFIEIARRVDLFFEAKNIQSGVRNGDDLFLPMDKHELAKAIERYALARLASAYEQAHPDQGTAALYLDGEVTRLKRALNEIAYHGWCNHEPISNHLDGVNMIKIARAALAGRSKP